MPQHIGILGGTFDPVHNGHLAVAEAALHQLALVRLLFVPNSHSPLKSAGPGASFTDRVAMLRLAVAGQNAFEISEIEGRRGGVSYTIDTVRELSALYPDSVLHLVIGADALGEFPMWREHQQIRQLAQLAYVERPGSPAADHSIPAQRLAMTPCDVSSTDIRARVRRGLSIDALVPAAVAAYIEAHRLYRS